MYITSYLNGLREELKAPVRSPEEIKEIQKLLDDMFGKKDVEE